MRPHDIHDVLRDHLLVDGYPMVLDTAASRGSWLVDARDGTRYLHVSTFYASSPLGMNHPGLTEHEAFRAELLEDLTARHPSHVSNVRGRGLLCAVDVPERAERDAITQRLMTEEHMLILGCGDRTLRFRPFLAVTAEELDLAVDALDRVLRAHTVRQ